MSADRLVIEALRSHAQEKKIDWHKAILAADAEGPGGPRWSRLLAVVQNALAPIRDKLLTGPEHVLASIRDNGVALKGPITTPVGGGFRSVNVALRKELDLYAQVRPCKTYQGVRTRFEDVDLVVVRENTEDLYAGIEYEQGTPEAEELIAWIESKGGRLRHRDAGISVKPISIGGTRRIVEFAFEHARRDGRRKVTAVHKANIMKLSDGLFLECARRVAQRHPEIRLREIIVDNCAMQLVKDPAQFDVLLLGNLYGDILSDLGAGLVGGLGVVPGANVGESCAVYEAVHGSAPDIAGRNVANPTALLLSALLMLRHIGEGAIADRIMKALGDVLREGRVRTRDLGGTASTTEYAEAICRALGV